MKVNTLKPSNNKSILNPYKKLILILIITLVLFTFVHLNYLQGNLSFLKLHFQEINFHKLSPSSSPPLWQCQVANYNGSESEKLGRECDLFKGKWISYPKGPYYTNETKCVIQDGQNCMKFGKPDNEFMKWRWKPDECELPLFDAARFLELIRGKSMVFVGDSVARNQMQSLGCLLSSAAHFVDESNPKTTEVKRWRYTDLNFTLTLIKSTHLVKSHGAGTSLENPINLYLDEADDAWATSVEDSDYVIISSGHWFSKPLIYYENRKIVGCSLCKIPNLPDLTMYYGYRMSFQTAFRALLDRRRFNGTVFLRTISPAHFEAGGNCLRTRPVGEREIRFDWYVWMLRMIQVEEFWAAERRGRRKGMEFGLLDITEAMRLRPDGHPNHYGHWPEKKQLLADCLHWCLPGPIDMWNEVLFQLLENNTKRK